MKIFITITLLLFSFVLTLPVRAEVWYDRLPRSGEYAPLPESTNPAPKDFEDINSSPVIDDDAATQDNPSVQAEPEVPSGVDSIDEAAEPVAAEEISSGNTFRPWLVFFVVLLGSALIIYLIWRRRPM